ncbi:NusA-like transcription termination signal-binding factor [Candidatus Woesearchaeota archaeon]|nr:NusA-like transcription termination signal-binding factor [Candidatus Woesearchaeota archaeon]
MKVITEEIIGYINLFENVTRARVKDCYQGQEALTFIVYEGEAGKAIGKNGENVKRLTSLIKKRIKVVEFSEDPLRFVSNLIFPIRAGVNFEDHNIIAIKGHGAKFKQAVLGPERKNLKELQTIVSNYFKFELKVV